MCVWETTSLILSDQVSTLDKSAKCRILTRFIIDLHAKITEKINSKWDNSSQNLWLQSVFTFKKSWRTKKKWKDEISSIHQIFDKVWLHQYFSNLKFRKKRRKWLSRRYFQWNEIFRYVRNSRSFLKKRKTVLCNVSCDFHANIWRQQ
jgi:hypothetical protein